MKNLENVLPQFVLSILILAGFAGIVLVYMLVDVSDRNSDVVKTIMTSMGTACLLVIGWWFSPSKSS
jgi:peptidoglycan/LPS O-acetylase OafA/YrhL